MSRSNQKKVHSDRRAARRLERKPKSVVRVRLIDGTYVFLTALIFIAALAGMIAVQRLGWFETVPGAVLSVVAGGIVVLCGFDLAMLLTNCITVADGQVNAGKNESGDLMIFHTENVLRVELRNRAGERVEENRRRYAKVAVTFVMASGRVNQRPFGHIRQRQLEQIRRAVGLKSYRQE